MNWVGGARNRLRGSLHTERKIQKEFFERKRLNFRSTTVRRETTSKTNSGEPKRKKHGQSQDVLSLKRQSKVVGANGLQASSHQNYKIINLDSRNVGPRKNANANVAWSKRVENVELPISPIETPSALRLSLSPPSKHENTESAPRAPGRESSKGSGQQNGGNVARFLFHNKGEHQASMKHINLFGAPHDRPVKINQPSQSKSSFAIHSSRVERKEPHDPVQTDGSFSVFANHKASERLQPHSWPNMDFHTRNLMVSEDFQTTPACSNYYDPHDLTDCSGRYESRNEDSLGFLKGPLTDNRYRFNHEEMPQLPRLGYNYYDNMYSSTMSGSNVNYTSEVFESASSNADSFEVSVVNSPPCRKNSNVSLNIDRNEVSQEYSPNRNANSIFAERRMAFDKGRADDLAVSDFAQRADMASMYPTLDNAQCKKGSRMHNQLRRDKFYANEREDLTGGQFQMLEQEKDLSSQDARCRQGQVNICMRNADVHADGKSRQGAGFQQREAVRGKADAYIVTSGLDFTPSDKDQTHGTVLCQDNAMLERTKEASNVSVKHRVPQRKSSSSVPNSSHPEEDPTVFHCRLCTDKGTQASATITKEGSLNNHVLPSCHAPCMCSVSSGNAESLRDAKNTLIQQSMNMMQERNAIHISSGHGSHQITGLNSSTRHCPDIETNFKQQFEEKTPRSRVSQVPAHSTVGVTVESPQVEMAKSSKSCTYEVLTHSVESTSAAEYQHPATTSSDTMGEKNRSSLSQNCVTVKDSTTTSMQVSDIHGPTFESTRSCADNDGRAGSSIMTATSYISQAPKLMDNDDGVTSSDIGPNADRSHGNRRPVLIGCDEGKTDNPDGDKRGQCIGIVHLETEMNKNKNDSQVSQGTQTTPKQLLFRDAACSPIWTFNRQDATQLSKVVAIADTYNANGKSYSLRSRSKQTSIQDGDS